MNFCSPFSNRSCSRDSAVGLIVAGSSLTVNKLQTVRAGYVNMQCVFNKKCNSYVQFTDNLMQLVVFGWR